MGLLVWKGVVVFDVTEQGKDNKERASNLSLTQRQM